jgi:hypothetical protein
VDMHDKAVEDFDVCAAQFLRRVNSAWQQRLHCQLMALRYMDIGFAKWHQDCAQYRRYVAAKGDYIFQIRTKTE